LRAYIFGVYERKDILIMSHYETVGASKSLKLAIQNVRIRRLFGYWPRNVGPLQRELQTQIDALIRAERSDVRDAAD
jgi:hypothetical protein